MGRGRKTDELKPIYLTVRISNEKKAELDRQSEITGKTLSDMMREAIEIVLGNKN